MANHITMLKEPECVAGCKKFTGDEIKHHKDCPFYPESLSKMFDDTLNTLAKLLKEKEPQVVETIPNETTPKTHDTFLVGFDKNKKIIFFKSYRWEFDRQKAISDSNWVAENCNHWEFGHPRYFKLSHENEEFEFDIAIK